MVVTIGGTYSVLEILFLLMVIAVFRRGDAAKLFHF